MNRLKDLKACLHEIESRRFSMQALGEIYTEFKYITLNFVDSFAITQTFGCDIYNVFLKWLLSPLNMCFACMLSLLPLNNHILLVFS